jgi:hypothetical protein
MCFVFGLIGVCGVGQVSLGADLVFWWPICAPQPLEGGNCLSWIKCWSRHSYIVFMESNLTKSISSLWRLFLLPSYYDHLGVFFDLLRGPYSFCIFIFLFCLVSTWLWFLFCFLCSCSDLITMNILCN